MTISELKAAYAPDKKAQEAIWVHGCDVSQIGLIKGIIASGRRSEICVTKISDPPFQNMGLLVKGKVTLMSKKDIGSKFNPLTGERHLFIKEDAVIDDYESILVRHYDELKNPEGSYTESFLIPGEIIGVYVCDFFMKRADEMDLEDIEALKEAAGVDTITVLTTSVK